MTAEVESPSKGLMNEEYQGVYPLEPPAPQADPSHFPYPVSVAQENGAGVDEVSAPEPPPEPAAAPEASAVDASVASIMHNMSWGTEQQAPPATLEGAPVAEATAAAIAPPPAGGAAAAEFAQHAQALPEVLPEVHARALMQAAAAAGLTPSAAMGAFSMLQEGTLAGQPIEAAALPSMAVTAEPEEEVEAVDGTMVVSGDANQPGDQSFTCSVCRKVFKREMNLIFHMTTHRPRQPQTESSEPTSTQPVKCQDCNKEFATKYQAKKHFLRRHFQGDKPFPCTKCNKKRFVVKEDLTMHMKSCGNVYVCTCGIRLCSLGALKRHCKYFSHEPESYEPKPEPGVSSGMSHPMNMPLEWQGQGGVGFRGAPRDDKESGHEHAAHAAGLSLMSPQEMQHRQLQAQLQQAQQAASMHGAGGPGDDPMNVCSHAAVMRSMMAGQSAHEQGLAAAAASSWQPELFQGMPLSLVAALRQAHCADQSTYRALSGMGSSAEAQMHAAVAGLGARGGMPGWMPGSAGPSSYAQMQHTVAAQALASAVSSVYPGVKPPTSSSGFCPPDVSDPLAWSRAAQEAAHAGLRDHPSAEQ